MEPNICQTICSAASGVGSFIYDYQTLITGFLAIGAALYAGTPVWRQLKDSNLQTRIMHRETLAMLLREAEERCTRIGKSIDEPLSLAVQLTTDHDGEAIEIGEYDAHGLEQKIGGRLDWYLITLNSTEGARVEEAKKALKLALDQLVDTLNDVQVPAVIDQIDEDHSIPDDEWAELIRKANEGKSLAANKVSAVSTAYRALKVAHQAAIFDLRQQIAQLDQDIARKS